MAKDRKNLERLLQAAYNFQCRKRAREMAVNSVPDKTSLPSKVFTVVEHPLVLASLSVVGGLVGALRFTPAFFLCALCILLGVHRSGVLTDQPRKTQITYYLVLTLVLSVGGYFLYGASDTALERLQTKFAKRVAELIRPRVATAATATEQDGFFDATSGKAIISLGGTFGLARDFSSFKNGYAEAFNFFGSSLVRLHLKNGALYCNIQMWQSREHQGVEITDGKYRVWPPQWDWNQSENEFEVVDENGNPVLQVIRKRSNNFQIYGLLVLPGGVVIANQQSTEALPWSEIKSTPSSTLKPIFKYPSQRFLGQYAVEH
jgi:hypothetical protein